MIVTELKTAIVQSRHRFYEAEAEPGSRSLTPCSASVKTLRRARLVCICYSRPAIGYDDVDLFVIAAFDTQRDRAVARRVFDRVVDQIPDRLCQKVRITVHRQSVAHIDIESGLLVLD